MIDPEALRLLDLMLDLSESMLNELEELSPTLRPQSTRDYLHAAQDQLRKLSAENR